MTSEQSKEREEMKAVSKNEENKGKASSLSEESKQHGKNLGTQSQEQNDDNNSDESLSPSLTDILPPEVLEELPANEKMKIERSLSIMALGSERQGSAIAKKLKPEHITQIIENSEKESQREFEKNKISENTKRLGIGAIITLVVVVLVYAGVTKDKVLSEKVILAGITAIGGFGAGYAVAKNK